ncbi:hypothetical protein OQJ66_19315 [Aquimarina muelleri]|nr:hypothetical protein [Aquimarina muelleri]
MSKMDLKNGIKVTDSLGNFSYKIPNISWEPIRFVDEEINALTVGDTLQGYKRFFSVVEMKYIYDWDWEGEQETVENNNNILETGEIYLIGQKRRYNIILYEDDIPQMILFSITVLDTVRKRHYTLSLKTEYIEYYKTRICEMKPILDSFEIKN